MWIDPSKEDQVSEIDIEGFKIRIDDLIKNEIMPEYFNSPLVCQWEITRACNLRCIHCYNGSGKKLPNELSHEEKIDVARQVVNAKIFRMCISGGEPILSESFWEIAKILNNGRILCNTITNGQLVDENNVLDYVRYFRQIQVSIDGAKPETHDKIRGKKGSWGKAVNACRLIVENGGGLSIASVISPFNIGELSELCDLAYELKAKELRFEMAKLVGRAALNRGNLMLSEKQLKKFEHIILEKTKEYKSKIMKIQISPKNLGSYVRSFSKIPQMLIYISPSGICAPDPTIPFSGGSLRENTLLEIWNNIKECHKDKEFLRLTQLIKTGRDFDKLEKIPYVDGELHDK